MKSFKKMIDELRSEVRTLYKNGVEIMYYMRGALSKEEMVNLTAFERDIFVEFLQERLEEEKKKLKHGLPMIY